MVLILALSKVSIAQNHNIYGVFPTYTADLKLNEQWTGSIYSFLSINPSEQKTEGTIYPSKTNAFYFETAISYHLNTDWSLTSSYTYERANPFRDDFRNENRFWLQGQHYKNIGKINLKNRLRYDF